MPKLALALVALTLIACFSTVVNIAVADNANFTVGPQEAHVIDLSLQKTDSVSGSFSVVSDDDTGVNFFVTDPQNKTILRDDNMKQKSFSFTAEETGSYQLHFDNSISAYYRKTVALNYSTTHFIMGMPQEQFLFLIIAAVALIGLLLFVVLIPK